MYSFKHTDFSRLTSSIFSSDPTSYFQHEKVHGEKQGQTDQEALRALMLAVLEDAIACFEGANAKLVQEAEEWLNSNDDGIFSFNNVCETLGLDPSRLRKGLERRKTKQIGTPTEKRKRSILNKGKCAGKKKDTA